MGNLTNFFSFFLIMAEVGYFRNRACMRSTGGISISQPLNSRSTDLYLNFGKFYNIKFQTKKSNV
jgi:allophanate hydrolase subunit 2